jgi:ABC-type bacteriocin/lantibiotic exporter with double-glycine peptidase domain
MAFILLSGLLHQPIKSITNLYSLLISTNVNLKRNEAVTEQSIRPALLLTEVIEESTFSDAQQRSQGDLSIEKLRFRYNKHSPDIIKEISFEINGLQKIAIIGQSGCGKSTLLHCLAGIFTSYQGTLLLNQLPLANYSESQLRRLLLLVSKQTRLISGTIYQNICVGDNFTNQEIIEVLNLVGLAEAVNKLPLGIHQPIAAEQSNLSQGQLKQLDLAAAIIRKPNILLLDEPFDTLDNALEDRVVDNLMSLSLTAIVITHRLRHLPLFDKVLWLEAGKIKAFDTHDKLMQQDQGYYNFINSGVM